MDTLGWVLIVGAAILIGWAIFKRLVRWGIIAVVIIAVGIFILLR